MLKKLSFLGVVLILSGCMNSGLFLSTNRTVVELSDNNFSIFATDVTGEASATYLIGFAFSYGAYTQSLSLIKIGGTEALYQEALKNLWENVRKKNQGKLQGKRLALINIRYDTQIVNFLLFNKIKLIVRADVVQFP